MTSSLENATSQIFLFLLIFDLICINLHLIKIEKFSFLDLAKCSPFNQNLWKIVGWFDVKMINFHQIEAELCTVLIFAQANYHNLCENEFNDL